MESNIQKEIEMQLTEMRREEMIDWLTDNDLHDWSNSASKDEYFAYLLFYGFKGYQQMTDEEIKYEYDERQA